MSAALEREFPASVGDVVTVGRACLGNPAGALAVVVELYQATWDGADYTGWSLLFENGNHDGFSPSDCDVFDVRKVGHDPICARYVWTNAVRLYQDWCEGKFASVWNGVRA